jgi:hypothetical protein
MNIDIIIVHEKKKKHLPRIGSQDRKSFFLTSFPHSRAGAWGGRI